MRAILDHISFNTHFKRNNNLISLMSSAGWMKDQIEIMFDHGIAYVVEEVDGKLISPMKYAVEAFDDHALVDVFVHHLGDDVQQYDNQYVIENYYNQWKKNFTFMDALFSQSDQGTEREYIHGKVKPGKEMFYSIQRYVTGQDIKKLIKFGSKDQNKLVVQTLRFQMNFKFDNALGIQFLELINQQIHQDFFENTDIGFVINYEFE